MTIYELINQGYIETEQGKIKIHKLRKTDDDIWSGEGYLEIEQQFYDYLDEGIAGIYAGLVPFTETYHIPVEIYIELENEDSDEVYSIDWEEVRENEKLV